MTTRRPAREAAGNDPPVLAGADAHPQATLIWGHHPGHGPGWMLTYDLEGAGGPEDHFFEGRREDFEIVLKAAQAWLRRHSEGGGAELKPLA